MKFCNFTDVTISDFNVAIKDPEQYITNALATTWINANDPLPDEKLIDMTLKGQLNPGPLRGLRISFKVNNISRVCLAQLTRHAWIFNSESHMCEPAKDLDRVYTLPRRLQNDKRVIDLITQQEKLFNDLLNENVLPRDARYIFPQASTVTCWCDCSIQDLKTAALLRLENGLADEINYVVRLIRRELIKLGGFYAKFAEKIDCLGANLQKALNVDDELGNSFNRFGSREDVKHRFDALNTSWWLDLQTLPDDLLLPGEKEMIKNLQSIERDFQ